MIDTKIIETKKDHYLLMIKGQSLGVFERSELRHIIQIIDNGI